MIFYNLEAEKNILGSILLDNTALHKCIEEKLTPFDFYDKTHCLLYTTFLSLYSQNQPIDLLTTLNVSKISPEYLTELFESIVSSANIRQYVKIVKEKRTIRDSYKIAHELQINIKQGKDIATLLHNTTQTLLEIAQDTTYHQTEPFYETIKRIAKESRENINKPLEYPLPFKTLEKDTQGLHRGELAMLGGMQKIGKSCLAYSVILFLLKKQKKGLLVSPEMNKNLVSKRFITMATKKNIFIRGTSVEDAEIANFSEYALKIIDKPLTIIDITTEIELYLPDFVVIDYLQIMNIPYGRDNRAKSVGEFGMQLKNLAIRYNIPILALSQLNDREELRESRELEQHSDVVLLLKREKGSIETKPQETLTLQVKYNRNGPVGSEKVIFMKKNLTFYEENAELII